MAKELVRGPQSLRALKPGVLNGQVDTRGKFTFRSQALASGLQNPYLPNGSSNNIFIMFCWSPWPKG